MTPLTFLDLTDHDTTVVQGTNTGTRVFRAECSCGWVSDWTDNQTNADDTRWDHYEVEG